MKKTIKLTTILLLSGLVLSACSLPSLMGGENSRVPQGEAIPSGPVLIKGEFEYTNDFVVETYYVEHAVGLLDMTGFVLRDKEWEMPVEGPGAGIYGPGRGN